MIDLRYPNARSVKIVRKKPLQLTPLLRTHALVGSSKKNGLPTLRRPN
jgi:hypothetical protein